ncbi:hypothetical protein LEMLEM_LOCUS2033 [Lemmus lemmus]
MCLAMFIAALFDTARNWKQPKCPSTEQWIRKMWFIYTMEYCIAEKNNDVTLVFTDHLSFPYATMCHGQQTQRDTGPEAGFGTSKSTPVTQLLLGMADPWPLDFLCLPQTLCLLE